VRILWLKTELLHPVDKGGKIRTYQMLKELKRDHQITYLTLDDSLTKGEAHTLAEEYANELVCIPHKAHPKFSAGFYKDLALNLITPLPYAIKKYASIGMTHEIKRRIDQKAFDVLVCDFLTPSVNVPQKLPCASVLFQHNVEAMIWKRHYEVQSHPVKKIYLKDQWRKMKSFERKECLRYDHVVAVSREDAETMRHEYGLNKVSDIPTGVDTEFFKPNGNGKSDRVPHNLVFTGSMDWLPNEDGIRYFTEEILPIIKESVPDVTLTVVGRNPYPSLVELSKRDPSVIVTGRVEDVRPYMEKAAAYVVPLRIGGGTRLKIYEAMAMEKPIVSTTIGAEGLPVRHESELLLADNPKDFAKEVVRLLTNEPLALSLSQRAAKLVREEFGWYRVAKNFAAICESTIR
jgi:polysaccharide biosynthesis protein PslH